MIIESSIIISCVDSKPKIYRVIRKAFRRNGVKIKRKVFYKVKYVKIKIPYLSGNIYLKVHDEFILGGNYIDENNFIYRCVTINRIDSKNIISELRNVNKNLRQSFISPSKLTLVSMTASE